VSVYTVKRKIMLKGKERQIVLDCLYQEIYEHEMRKSGFAARSAMIAKTQSQLKYENISHRQRVEIYSKFIQKEIIKYIKKDLQKSNSMYWVNGSPEKRDMRIEEYARYAYARMPKNQKIAICLKLEYKFM
jgi:hypothetical protein